MNSFTPGLLRNSPSALKRCLQKMLKLSMNCREWLLVHAIESHLFSANSLPNLSAPPLTGGIGPLINTFAFRELTVVGYRYTRFADQMTYVPIIYCLIITASCLDLTS